MTDPFGTTHYDRTGQTRIKEESVTDHLDRAAKAMWGATTSDGLRAAIRPDCWAMAKALDAAGLLASPERDAEVAAKALRDADDWTLAAELVKRGFLKADLIEQEAGESGADA